MECVRKRERDREGETEEDCYKVRGSVTSGSDFARVTSRLLLVSAVLWHWELLLYSALNYLWN